MEENFGILLVLSLVVCTTLGGMIGGSRGRQGAGMLCGFLLGPLGVIISLFLPVDERALAAKSPGAAVKRVRAEYKKPDPLEAFEAHERARKAFDEVPEHLRGRKVEEENL